MTDKKDKVSLDEAYQYISGVVECMQDKAEDGETNREKLARVLAESYIGKLDSAKRIGSKEFIDKVFPPKEEDEEKKDG